MRRLLVVSLVAVLALSCNRRVFEEVQNACNVTIQTTLDIPVNKAADILIVIDNSGSMQDKQDNLVANFLNQNPQQCPLTDLANIPTQFQNPARELYTGNGPLAQCGFIQLLAAFQSDFRVGVITSDVGLCDNRLPAEQAQFFCQANQTAPECQGTTGGGWGFRPQRGCLQPDGPPGTVDKVIAASDLKAGGAKADLAQRFKDTLTNIRTFGSPYERELDAAAIFLQQVPGVEANPSCKGDFDLFRRQDAALTVIFLSDENDCSHDLPGATIGDELKDEICGEFTQPQPGQTCDAGCKAFNSFISNNSPDKCYANVGTPQEDASPKLSPVTDYRTALLAADPNVKVAVIAGGLGAPGNVTAGGCVSGSDGNPKGGTCRPSGGLENFTASGQPCDPSAQGAQFPDGCCLGDPGTRYFDLANSTGKTKATDSVCNASFRASMLDIAALVAAADSIELAEPPANPNDVVVRLTKAGQNNPTVIQHLPDGADCNTTTGWRFENATRVDLCGAARPGPGDTLDVQAEGTPKNGCQ
jgi:hypothetical protein